MKKTLKALLNGLVLVLILTDLTPAFAQAKLKKPDVKPITHNKPPIQEEASDDILIYLGAVVLGAILVGVVMRKKKGNENDIDHTKLETYQAHLVQDKDVTVEGVLESIRSVVPAIIPSRAKGFTERDIEKQMLSHLRGVFQNVQNQKQLNVGADPNTKIIDLDVGNGLVGVELKVGHDMKNVGKREELLRQLEQYEKRSYKKENVIAVIAGFDDVYRDPRINELETTIRKQGHEFVFLNAGELEK